MLNLKISIKTKISAVITLSIVIVVIIMCSITVIYQLSHMEEFENKILKDSVGGAATVAYTIMPYFVEKDFTAMNNLISYFSKRSDRAYLLVVDNGNRIMARSSYAKTGSTFETPPASETEKINDGLIRKYIRDGEKSIEISYPIKSGDLVLGTVILGLNTDWVQNEKNIIRKTIFTFSGVSLAIILVGIMLGSAIADRIAQPILLLKQTAENVGKGDYTQVIYTKNRDEVGALAAAFNKMLEELKNARTQLVDKKYVESIIANMNDALIVLSSEGRIKTVNKTTLNLLGYREDELINQPFGLIHEDAEFHTNGISPKAAAGPASMAEKILLSKSGRKIPALISFAFLRGEETRAGMVCVVKDITELKIAEEQILSALREKEILLKEIHHRVKNNLQVVASMLHLQAGYIKDSEARTLFEESQKRVESMALMHEKLYRAKDLARIDFREYVVDLAGNLLTLNTDKASRIEMKVDIEGVMLDINNSIPCGLIINELVSNALAHAFPDGRKGRIDISMRSGSGGRIGLTVRDNGTGFPGDIDFRNTASLGMQLVTSLVKQLGGLIEMDRTEGTSFSIEFQA
jgi:PAS domain S-box-containing protein